MRMLIQTIIMLLTGFFLLLYAENTKDTFSLKVKVDSLRNSKGSIQFAIYDKDGSIPDEDFENFYKIQREKIVNNQSETIFKDLPKGIYAVSILHDENENGKIDKGFILPKEGIGFSNIIKIGITNRPNFKKASFQLNKDSSMIVKIIYL